MSNTIREPCQGMCEINHTRMAHVSNENMQTLGSNGVKFDNVLLLVTDAAP
jgi:hypothetical protein